MKTLSKYGKGRYPVMDADLSINRGYRAGWERFSVSEIGGKLRLRAHWGYRGRHRTETRKIN
jgi:hypothetical protein